MLAQRAVGSGLTVLALVLATQSISPSAGGAVPTCDGMAPTIVGTTGDDVLRGTPGDDVILGRGGDDRLRGSDGDDALCAGPGADVLRGGPGADVLLGGRDGLGLVPREGWGLFGDRLVGGRGDDRLDGGWDTPEEGVLLGERDILDYSTAHRRVRLDLSTGTAVGMGADEISTDPWRVLGSAYDDIIIGGDHADEIESWGGADYVSGGEGNDLVRADPSMFTDNPDDAPDELVGGPGNDRLMAGGGADALTGGEGDDSLTDDGRTGADLLQGGADSDYLADNLTASTDQTIDGGAGADEIVLRTWFLEDGKRIHPAGETDLGTGVTTITWTPDVQAQVISATSLVVPGNWTVFGTGAAETLQMDYWSEAGPVVFHAEGGDDFLRGSPFADHLDGGEGDDTAEPRGGADTCVGIEHLIGDEPCTG